MEGGGLLADPARGTDPSVAPQVSVIVPVKDRRVLLGGLLDALESQTFRDFEVVVVDDGSTDGSAAVARRKIAGRPVVVLDGAGRGAVEARRFGVEQAAAPLLAFTDSDCVPCADWLAEGVRAITAGADVVNGRTRPARPVRPLEHSVWSGPEGLYPTCNVFYRRSAFMRAGGFDPEAGHRLGFRVDTRSRADGFGEDTLLAWRVARAGRAVYSPIAVVEHHVFEPNFVELLSRTVRVAAFPALVREVPELRRTLLIHRVQLGRRSRLPVYCLVLALTGRPRWKPLTPACLAWWIAQRVRDLRRADVGWSRCLVLVPAEMAIDVLTAAALVVGSVRDRSITL